MGRTWGRPRLRALHERKHSDGVRDEGVEVERGAAGHFGVSSSFWNDSTMSLIGKSHPPP